MAIKMIFVYVCRFFVQSLLIQIRSTIMSDSQAQLAHDANRPYTEREAKDSFARMVDKYGWNKWTSSDTLNAWLGYE